MRRYSPCPFTKFKLIQLNKMFNSNPWQWFMFAIKNKINDKNPHDIHRIHPVGQWFSNSDTNEMVRRYAKTEYCFFIQMVHIFMDQLCCTVSWKGKPFARKNNWNRSPSRCVRFTIFAEDYGCSTQLRLPETPFLLDFRGRNWRAAGEHDGSGLQYYIEPDYYSCLLRGKSGKFLLSEHLSHHRVVEKACPSFSCINNNVPLSSTI